MWFNKWGGEGESLSDNCFHEIYDIWCLTKIQKDAKRGEKW